MTKVTFKGNPVTLSGKLPSLHAQAPDFKLVDKDLKDHSLKDYKGKRKLISTNPSLDTSVCSMVAQKFNEAIKKHPGIVALIVTADLPFAQKRFCEHMNAHNIVTLSMMRSKDFAKDYGILIVDGPLAGLCARAVIVLDEHDKVLYTELVPEITQEPNYDQALHFLRS